MSLDALKEVTDTIGHVYGTDDFPIYVYSLIKMQKLETPSRVWNGARRNCIMVRASTKRKRAREIIYYR